MIIQVSQPGVSQGMPKTLTFRDCHVNEIEDDLEDLEDYSDDGSYAHGEDSHDESDHDDGESDDDDDSVGDNDSNDSDDDDDDGNADANHQLDLDEQSTEIPPLIPPNGDDDAASQASSNHESQANQDDVHDGPNQTLEDPQEEIDVLENQGVKDIQVQYMQEWKKISWISPCPPPPPPPPPCPQQRSDRH